MRSSKYKTRKNLYKIRQTKRGGFSRKLSVNMKDPQLKKAYAAYILNFIKNENKTEEVNRVIEALGINNFKFKDHHFQKTDSSHSSKPQDSDPKKENTTSDYITFGNKSSSGSHSRNNDDPTHNDLDFVVEFASKWDNKIKHETTKEHREIIYYTNGLFKRKSKSLHYFESLFPNNETTKSLSDEEIEKEYNLKTLQKHIFDRYCLPVYCDRYCIQYRTKDAKEEETPEYRKFINFHNGLEKAASPYTVSKNYEVWKLWNSKREDYGYPELPHVYGDMTKSMRDYLAKHMWFDKNGSIDRRKASIEIIKKWRSSQSYIAFNRKPPVFFFQKTVEIEAICEWIQNGAKQD
jgi:hypothetical protein